MVALALGGLLGSLLAWGIGEWFGPTDDVVAHARAVGEGVTFDAPLELKATGAVLAWPVAAMVVHLALTALFGPRDPEPEWPTGHGRSGRPGLTPAAGFAPPAPFPNSGASPQTPGPQTPDGLDFSPSGD